MQEKKQSERIDPVQEFEKSSAEILVANGRSFEPFIKTFVSSGDNVSRLDLGMLVGVFEVNEQSEDSAYIVNFLASVAKKEYFSNPRRGAIESLEAALHKINLALAELVKHGNIAWLGKLHGVLGVFEKNNLHFSATGDGNIILFRGDTMTDIASGLASEESAVHPIKTFIEISSGRLFTADRIIFSSPELLRLFSLEDLTKNALRMDEARFDQFLRTALVNELDMSGTIIIHIGEGIAPSPKKSPERKHGRTEKPEPIRNVFSQSAFVPNRDAEEAEPASVSVDSAENRPKSDYIDSKTGHIYIQGNEPEAPSAHPLLDQAGILFQEAMSSTGFFFVSRMRWLRKARKQASIALDAIVEEARAASRKTIRSIKKQWRRRERLASAEHALPSTPLSDIAAAPRALPEEKLEDTALQTPNLGAYPEPEPTQASASAPQDTEDGKTEIPLFIREKLAAFYKKNQTAQKPEDAIEPSEKDARKAPSRLQHYLELCEKTGRSARVLCIRSWSSTKSFTKFLMQGARTILQDITAFYRHLPPLHKRIILSGSVACILIILLVSFLALRNTSPKAPAISESQPTEEAAPAFPIATEKNAHLLGDPIVLAKKDHPIITALLSGDTFLISPHAITNLRENKDYPLPDGSGNIAFASVMDDLRLIFVYTDTGNLFAWSPISRTFIKNTLNLPAGTVVKGIGTYLTYLYVLDSQNNQIYRFPRADGGFGASSNWLRDTVTFGDGAKIAVNETLFVAPDKTALQAFFRGHLTKNLESPTTPLLITDTYTHSGTQNIYALDRDNKRVIVWNQDGALIAQYFSDQLAEAASITANESTNELLITTSSALLSFKFNPTE